MPFVVAVYDATMSGPVSVNVLHDGFAVRYSAVAAVYATTFCPSVNGYAFAQSSPVAAGTHVAPCGPTAHASLLVAQFSSVTHARQPSGIIVQVSASAPAQ